MKNRTTKVALILLALVLATTCVVCSTFARYITAEDINDEGRVTRWGVEVTTHGHLFGKQYQDLEVAENVASITVNAGTYAGVRDNVVAPGTRNDEGMTFTLEGTPEVDVKLDVVVEVTDIELAAGEYTDYTVGNWKTENAKFTLADDYYPVVFTVKNGAGEQLVQGNLAAIEAFFEGLTTANIPANSNLASGATFGNGDYLDIDGTYVLTWAWDIDVNNQADTFLGNEGGFVDAANDPADPTYRNNDVVFDVNGLQDIAFSISITVTQID